MDRRNQRRVHCAALPSWPGSSQSTRAQRMQAIVLDAFGGAENFGRSYKADNYYETLSNMVLRATYNLLANPGFHQAMQKS